MTEPIKRTSLFEHLFAKYGAGSDLFKPITKLRCYNGIAWTVIVLGVVGWAIFLWILEAHSTD